MAETDFHEKLRAHRAHMALVPSAIEVVRERLIDFNGQPLSDNEAPRDGLLCGELRTLLREVERLQAREKQLLQDAREAEREFSREAREIAAEARWEGQEETRGGHY